MKSIKVLVPANVVTGGTECMHLVGHVLSQVSDVVFHYVDGDKSTIKPHQFAHYAGRIDYGFPDDLPSQLIIGPETLTGALSRFKESKVIVYWLSVDNYLSRKHQSRSADVWNFCRRVLRMTTALLFQLKRENIYHFAQSSYALEFLSNNGISASLISDFVASRPEYIRQPNERESIVLFNPKKGFERIRPVMEQFVSFKFVPLADMTHQEICQRLGAAKIYIDFGHHPGRDRLPREAALMGCCVVSNFRGSASNEQDLAIPHPYKIDDRARDYVSITGRLIEEILENYTEHFECQSSYRSALKAEREVFEKNLVALVSGVINR